VICFCKNRLKASSPSPSFYYVRGKCRDSLGHNDEQDRLVPTLLAIFLLCSRKMPTRYCTGIRPPLHPLGASLNKTGLSPALIFFIVFLILLTIKFLSLSLFDCQETPLSHSLTFSLSFRSLVTARRTGGSGRVWSRPAARAVAEGSKT
jgi:hypothetical protein